MKKLFLGIVFYLLSHPIFCQTTDNHGFSKWTFKYSLGYSLAVSEWNNSKATDDLISAFRRPYTSELIGVEYYPYERIGLAISVTNQFGFNTTEKYYRNLQDYFPDHFVVSHYEKKFETEERMRHTNAYLIGLVHRAHAGKVHFRTKLLAGIMHFHAETATILIKEQDSHKYLSLRYSPSKYRHNPVTGALEISTGYEIHPMLLISGDLRFTSASSSLIYTEYRRDLLNQVNSQVFHNYQSRIKLLSFCVSLNFRLFEN